MKRSLLIICVILAFVVLTSITILLSIPYLADAYLFPRLLANLPVTEKQLQISRLTPWSLQGNLNLGENSATIVSLPRFELHYTLAGIIRGKIDTLLVDGATLNLAYSEGKLTLHNFNSSPRQNKEINKQPMLLAFAPEQILLRDCRLVLSRQTSPERNFRVDGSLQVQYQRLPDKHYLLQSLQGELQVQGDIALAAKLSMQPTPGGHTLSLEAESPDLSGITELLPLPKQVDLSGEMHLEAQLALTEHLSHLGDFDLRLLLPGFQLRAGNLTAGADSSQPPPMLTAGGNLREMHYSLTNLHTISPISAALSLKGDSSPITGRFTGDGFITPESPATPIPVSIELALTPDSRVATVNINLDHLDLADRQLQLEDTRLKAQLRLPDKEAATPSLESSLTVEKILYKQEALATLAVNLSQQNDEFTFTGALSSLLNSGLQVLFDGGVSRSQPLHITYSIPEVAIDTTMIPTFLPVPPDLLLSGTLQARGDMHLSGKTPGGTLQIQFHDGGIELTDKKIILSDINSSLLFPDIPKLHSAPNQLLTIGNMDIGSLKFSNGRVNFRIEDHHTLFIEKSRMSWCSGKVEGGSLRISTKKTELSTTLYCDRLNFSELLDQFGITETEGDSSLNGRLPISISETGLSFDDGFLFSTPGNSGIVRFNNTRMLRQGMPDIGQAAYLDYSLQALENFSYNWTKLTFNSIGDDLLISMQIDGKPEKPLPFGYKNGQIIPLDDGLGIQHPIRLDVNFNLPFGEMLKYGHNIQTIMENM